LAQGIVARAGWLSPLLLFKCRHTCSTVVDTSLCLSSRIRGGPNPKARAMDAHHATSQRPVLLGSNMSSQHAMSTRSARTKATTSGLPAPLNTGRCRDASPRDNAKNQVLTLLKGCGLQMYSVKLFENGFDEMETLHAIDDADLKDLGMPPHHVMRLRRSLRELLQHEDTVPGGDGHGVVAAFLEEHGLEQYAATILSSGFDEMETLLDVDDLDLKDLGLPRGHALKLRRHLRDYETNRYAVEEHNVAAAPPAEVRRRRGHPVPAAEAPPAARAVQPRLDASEKMKGDVERSWESIQKLGTDAVGAHIYRRFFELVPEAMENFPAHVRAKYRDWTAEENEDHMDLSDSVALRKLFGKFLNAIGCVVTSVVVGQQDSSKLVPLLTSLGGRHIAYGLGGVNEAFFPALGKAINMTLLDLLGEGFTTEVENAWNVVFGFASSIMIAGMREAMAASQQQQQLKDLSGARTRWRSHSSQASSTTDPSEGFSSQCELSD